MTTDPAPIILAIACSHAGQDHAVQPDMYVVADGDGGREFQVGHLLPQDHRVMSQP